MTSLHIVDRYGIVPETVYSGLKDGASRHSHEELSVALKAYTDAVIGNRSKRLSASWIDGLNGILDAYLGPCPEKKNSFTTEKNIPEKFCAGAWVFAATIT